MDPRLRGRLPGEYRARRHRDDLDAAFGTDAGPAAADSADPDFPVRLPFRERSRLPGEPAAELPLLRRPPYGDATVLSQGTDVRLLRLLLRLAADPQSRDSGRAEGLFQRGHRHGDTDFQAGPAAAWDRLRVQAVPVVLCA